MHEFPTKFVMPSMAEEAWIGGAVVAKGSKLAPGGEAIGKGCRIFKDEFLEESQVVGGVTTKRGSEEGVSIPREFVGSSSEDGEEGSGECCGGFIVAAIGFSDVVDIIRVEEVTHVPYSGCVLDADGAELVGVKFSKRCIFRSRSRR